MSSVFLAPAPTNTSTCAVGPVGGAVYWHRTSGGWPASTAAWTGVCASVSASALETSAHGSGGAAGAGVDVDVVVGTAVAAVVVPAPAAVFAVPPQAATTTAL